MLRTSPVSPAVPPVSIIKEDDASVSCSTLSKADSSASGKTVSSLMRRAGGKLSFLRKRNDGTTALTLSANSHLDESEIDSLCEPLDDSNTTRDDDGLMLDKFGFIVEMEDISEEEHSLANSSKKKDDSSKLKTNQKLAIANFAKLLNAAVGDAAGPTHSMVKNFARKGFPDSMRRQAWTVITGVDKIMKESEGVYSNLSQDTEKGDDPNRSSAFKAIDKDILRTFPTHQMFRQQASKTGLQGDNKEASNTGLQGDNKEDNKEVVEPSEGEGCTKLRRILRAYVSYDSDLGYCQGMNFIAATFLMFLSEEEAFWLLVVVMNEDPWRLRDLFNKDMSGTLETLYIAEHLMIQFLPKLVSQFHVAVLLRMLGWQCRSHLMCSSFLNVNFYRMITSATKEYISPCLQPNGL